MRQHLQLSVYSAIESILTLSTTVWFNSSDIHTLTAGTAAARTLNRLIPSMCEGDMCCALWSCVCSYSQLIVYMPWWRWNHTNSSVVALYSVKLTLMTAYKILWINSMLRFTSTAGIRCMFMYLKTIQKYINLKVIIRYNSWRSLRKQDEREVKWHAAKGHRSDSNPEPLRRGHSLCTRGAHSPNS